MTITVLQNVVPVMEREKKGIKMTDCSDLEDGSLLESVELLPKTDPRLGEHRYKGLDPSKNKIFVDMIDDDLAIQLYREEITTETYGYYNKDGHRVIVRSSKNSNYSPSIKIPVNQLLLEGNENA